MVDSFYPFPLHLSVWFVIANIICIDLSLTGCSGGLQWTEKRAHCVLAIFWCVFDYCLVTIDYFYLAQSCFKKHTFHLGEKKGNGTAAGLIPLQYPASPTPRTVEATGVLQLMGTKSSRSHWLCLQYCLMRHEEERTRSCFSVHCYVSRTACPHRDFTGRNIFTSCPFSVCTGAA